MDFKGRNFRIYYVYAKAKSKRTWVFLHGLGGDLGAWNPYTQFLRQRGESCLSLDLPGHGLSARLAKPVTMDLIVADVMALLQALSINRPILVGHCFGGMVALELALRWPKHFRQLILLCTAYRLPFWLKFVRPAVLALKATGLRPIRKHVNFSRFLGTGNLDFRRLYSDWHHVGSRSYSYLAEALMDWNRDRDLAKIKVPTLVIAGLDDWIFPPNLQRQMAAKIPGASLVMLKTNHIAPINALPELKELLEKQLA